jgi:hypothetical protein
MSDITFLSRDEVLILFNGEEDYGTALAVYSLSLQQIICICQLPCTLPFRAIFLKRPESRFGDKCPSSTAKILVPDPWVNILGINFKLEEGPSSPWVCVILSLHKFQNMCNSLLEKYPGRDRFDWEEWGPTVTRWFPSQQIGSTGSRCIFGSRMVVWGSAGLPDPRPSSCILLDFNPRPILRDTAYGRVVTQETVWEDKDVGLVVKSSLPYRVFTAPRLSGFDFRFDGNTIMSKWVRSCNLRSPNLMIIFFPSTAGITSTHFCPQNWTKIWNG